MVKKKRPSKRLTLKNKYKVQRKVNEAHRKTRREAKANPKSRFQRKDPGVPNEWPFKEQTLMEIEKRREKLAEEKAKQKESRAALVAERRKMKSTGVKDLHQLAKDANKRDKAFDKAQSAVEANTSNVDVGAQGSFYKELQKVLECSDVILEVLDARDPLGCRCPQLEKMVMEQSSRKRVVLVLNKIDLVPAENVEAWLKYLRQELPAVAFKASTQSQRKHMGHAGNAKGSAIATVNSAVAANTTACLGAESLLGLLKNYSRNGDLKMGLTVGIVGYPNVGKSSVINSLKRAKAVAVGSTPGLTRSAQMISLDKKVKLYDCPGIIFSKQDGPEVFLRNCLKVEQLPDPVPAAEALLRRCNKVQLMRQYAIADYSTVAEFLTMVAQKRGKFMNAGKHTKGGIVDLESSARMVLNDWNSGKIKFFTTPPQRRDEETVVVTQWRDEVDLEELANADSEVMQTLDTDKTGFMSVEASATGTMDMQQMEEDSEESEEEEEEGEGDEMSDED